MSQWMSNETITNWAEWVPPVMPQAGIVLQLSEYTRPSNKAEVAGLAKCNVLKAQAVLLSLPQALCRVLPVTSSGPPRPAPSGSRRGKEKTLSTAEECCQQMLTMDGGTLSELLGSSNRLLSISTLFLAGLQSSKNRGRTCQEDNTKLIGYSRRCNTRA